MMNTKKLILGLLILILGCSVKIAYASQPTSKIAGSLTVGSNPEGAEIYLDCIDTGKTTPYTFHDLVGYTEAYSQTLSTHPVTVRKVGYPNPGLKFVHVKADAPNNINFNLTSVDTGSLEVTSTKAGYNKTSISNEFTISGSSRSWKGDCYENGHLLNLPFSFPFYGNSYDSVYVFNAGYLNFTSNIAQSSYYMPNKTVIVPFGVDEIATNGTAQPGEDIYISTTTTSVTIRWCAEYEWYDWEHDEWKYEPVNFEVVLYNNGEIKFNYGSGNLISDYGVYYFCRGISSENGSSYDQEYIYYYEWSSYADSIIYSDFYSQDNGASIYLDGINTGQITPYTFNNLIAGTTHYVTVRQDPLKYDYYILPGQRSFEVIEDSTVVEDFPVNESYGSGELFVYNKISDANIYIDGIYTEGISYYAPYDNEDYPYKFYSYYLDRIKDNLHWVTVRKDGCLKPGLDVFEADYYGYPQQSYFDLYPSDIEVDKIAYFSMTSSAGITVEDINANVDTYSVDAVTVTVTSSIDPGETIILTETGNDTGIFRGTVGFEASAIASNDKVAVQDDKYFTVTYYDSITSTSRITSSYFNANYTGSDLVLKREITPVFLAYLQTKEEEFLALPESDTKNIGLALIQVGYMNLILQDKMIRGGDILDGMTNIIEDIESIIKNEFSDITWNPGSSIIDKTAVEAILSKITELVVDEKWENDIAPSIRESFTSLDDIIANIDPLLRSIFDYEYEYDNFKNIEKAASDYRNFISKVSTASFNYEIELETEAGSSTWTITGQDVENMLSDADDFSINVSTGMDLIIQGFDTIKTAYNETKDTTTIRLGRDDIIAGLESINAGVDRFIVLLSSKPFIYYDPDISILETFKDKVTILKDIIDGKTYPFGEDKTICPVAWVESLPSDVTKPIVEYYSLPSIIERSSYTFAGLFPDGLPQEVVDALEPHPYAIFNIFIDTETLKARLDEAESYCMGELAVEPNDPKANMTMALIKLFDFIELGPKKIDDIISSLEESDFNTFLSIFEEFNVSVDSVTFYIDKLASLNSQFTYTMIFKFTRNDESPFEVNMNDDIVPVPIPSFMITEWKSTFDFLATLTDILSNEGENFDNFPYDVNINPNTLDFTGCYDLQDYINALRVSNPNFLKLKTLAKDGVDGEKIIKDIGKDITKISGYNASIGELLYKIACIARDEMKKTDIVWSDKSYYWRSYDELYHYYPYGLLDYVETMRDMVSYIYQDFKYSAKYTTIFKGYASRTWDAGNEKWVYENPKYSYMNLSAWFDNVPTGILSIVEEYFINGKGTLGGLFPTEMPTGTPYAVAGNDIFVLVNVLVTLDGEESYDPENDSLTYQWTFVSGPAQVTLSNLSAMKPTFTPTVPGSYKFKLVVSDGQNSSEPDFVWVTVANTIINKDTGGTETISSNLGEIKVEVSGGTFDKNVVIAIETNPLENPRKIAPSFILAANEKDDATGVTNRIAGTMIEINVFDPASSDIITTFNNEVKITIPYKDTDDNGFVDDTTPPVNEKYLKVYRLDETTQKWVCDSGSIVDEDGNYVTTMVSHFSVFVAMGAPGDSSNAVVYPSPFKPGSGGDFDALYITFDNLSPKASIKIYNIAGQLVKELSNTEEESYITWDITLNDSGDKAASGVYFFAVRDEDGKTTTGKFSIIK